MAKVIWRAGKVGVEILFVLLAFGLIFYSARVFTVAEEQSIPVSGSNNTEAEALLEQVKQAIKAGQLQEAKQISDQIVQAWPGTVYAMDALGEIGYLCVLEDDDAGVANVMTQLYGNYSGQPKITIAIDRVAKGYLPKRTPAKASVIYNEALTKMPNHPKVFRLHAGIIKCQIMQEDFTQAEAGLEQLWSQYSSAEAFVQILNSIKYTYRLIHNYSA
ncbi:hypothetical protein KAR91_76710, partial [Candidatus Pacearchaeota archaeon]|nr:hypothetical protein [Candidatus Pacearchaeota archaeon]